MSRKLQEKVCCDKCASSNVKVTEWTRVGRLIELVLRCDSDHVTKLVLKDAS